MENYLFLLSTNFNILEFVVTFIKNNTHILFGINFILVLSIIFLESKKTESSWSWILVLSLLPFLGFILYLLLGRPIYREKIFPYSKDKKIDFQRKLIDSQSAIPYTINTEVGKKHSNLMQLNFNSNQSFLSINNEVTTIIDGKEKFEKLFEDIKNAKSYIHIQYYIIKNDSLGKELFNLLIDKLNSGVEVYLLYDDIGSRTLNSFTLRKLIKAGAKTKSFFKSQLPLINLRMNYRNHRKLVIIDGEIGYVGGFNVGNEYLGLDKKMGYWRDTHLRIKGEAVSLLNLRFIDDWNSQIPNKKNIEYIDIEKHLSPTKFKPNTKIPIQIVTSGPDEDIDQIKLAYIHMINKAKKYIYIQSPYFILDDSIMDALHIAILSGVEVKIMIPDKSDHFLVKWANYSNVGKLVLAGADAYEYNKGFIHAKTIIIDDEVTSIGTANFDNRSFALNFEINAFVYDENITSSYKDIFLEDLKNSTKITKEIYETRPLSVKFKESIMQLIAPIL